MCLAWEDRLTVIPAIGRPWAPLELLAEGRLSVEFAPEVYEVPSAFTAVSGLQSSTTGPPASYAPMQEDAERDAMAPMLTYIAQRDDRHLVPTIRALLQLPRESLAAQPMPNREPILVSRFCDAKRALDRAALVYTP